MGSTGGSSKKNDRTPLPSLRKGKSGSEGGGRGSSEGVCPVSFQVELKQVPILKVGQSLSIDDDGIVKMFGSQVGVVTKNRLKVVLHCKGNRINYAGLVARGKKKGQEVYYGEFRQR